MTRSLSIIIPAYNEERRLAATLAKIGAWLDRAPWSFREIVVVDDGSTDKTVEVAARFPGVRVVGNPANRGKGYAVCRGMLEARGEWALLTDADLSTPIEEFERLWARSAETGAPVVIGSRALDRSLIGVHQPFPREAVGRVFNVVMRLITGLPFRDTQCGFKLFRTDVARDIFSRQVLEGFGFDVEVLVIARELGWQVEETAVRWNDVAGTTVSLRRGVAAFLDPLRVAWYAWRGRYRR